MDKIEKIVWTHDGISSLEEIVVFIAKDSEYYASNFAKNILINIEKLKVFPYMGRAVPEYDRPDVRELIYQNYRIVYKVKEKTIYIALISHGSQPLPTSLD